MLFLSCFCLCPGLSDFQVLKEKISYLKSFAKLQTEEGQEKLDAMQEAWNKEPQLEDVAMKVFVVSAADILLCTVTKKTAKEIADLYRYSEAAGMVIDNVNTVVKNKLDEADKASKAISKAEAKESRAKATAAKAAAAAPKAATALKKKTK